MLVVPGLPAASPHAIESRAPAPSSEASIVPLTLIMPVATIPNGTVKSFAGILEGKGLPRLEYLGIVNSEWERELIVALARSPLVKRIRTLDLTKGTMWREATQALLENAAAFRHLELLDLADNYFDDEMARAIKKAIPCANVDDQKQLDDDDDDDPYRYVTVGE